MKMLWFKKWGSAYLPVHSAGVITSLLAILFLVTVYATVIRYGHPVSNGLYNMFVYTTCTAFWWKRIAEKTTPI